MGGVFRGEEKGRGWGQRSEREGRKGIWNPAKARSSSEHTVQECQQSPPSTSSSPLLPLPPTHPPVPLPKRGGRRETTKREAVGEQLGKDFKMFEKIKNK